MKKDKLVSILSPCYNVEVFLPRCLDSIINQTYPNLQIVMIDDGSKDGTWQILQEYAAKDSRIEICHQENQGVATTRNLLLDKIEGDYFIYVDSDDWIEPETIEVLLSYTEKECSEIVTCGIIINEDKTKSNHKRIIYNRNEIVERFLYHLEFRGSLCNKLFKTSLLNKHTEFQHDISFGEDALFCWELLKQVNKVVYTDHQFYHYQMNSESICHSPFGPKKLSGHKVWKKICEETAELYPQYLPIAQARFCIEATLLLRDAAHCGYQESNNVRMLQDTIKRYWYRLSEVDLTSFKMKLYAFLACRSYWLAGKI